MVAANRRNCVAFSQTQLDGGAVVARRTTDQVDPNRALSDRIQCASLHWEDPNEDKKLCD